MLAVDLVEHSEKGLVVNEINHTMEFHTMQPVSGIDIAGEIVEYAVKVVNDINYREHESTEGDTKLYFLRFNPLFRERVRL
ncbi:MAG: hypothetical protein U0X87_02010 [Anaerolineales bacterium]